jgi:hypothetical protein
MTRLRHTRAVLCLLALVLTGAMGCEDSKVAWSISPRNQMVAVVNNSSGAVTISYDRELIEAAVTFISMETESIYPGNETRIVLHFGADGVGRITVSGAPGSRVYLLSRGQTTLTIDNSNLP